MHSQCAYQASRTQFLCSFTLILVTVLKNGLQGLGGCSTCLNEQKFSVNLCPEISACRDVCYVCVITATDAICGTSLSSLSYRGEHSVKNSWLIMIHIQPSTQQTLLITQNVSALMGHLQVFPFIHYQLTALERELHTFSLTYVGHIRPHLFSLPPYLGILTSVGLLYLSDIKVKIAL
jgi:hypothetical protein